MLTCVIVPVAVDESEDDVAALVSSIKSIVPNVQFYFGVDEDYDNPWLLKYGSVTRVNGFGVGKALEAALRETIKDDCDYVIKSDAHIVFKEFEYPLGLEVAYHCTMDGTCFGASYAKWPSMDWVFTWGKVLIMPQTTEPVYAYPANLARAMINEFNCAYCVPYWGAESYDFTLTSCRHYSVCPMQGKWRVYHRHKSTWPKARIERKFPSEPWMSSMRGHPYFTSMIIGWQIYLARHVDDPSSHPKYDAKAFQVALQYYGNRMRHVPGYPVEWLYRKLGITG